MAKQTSKNGNNGANLGYEAKLFQAADKMRSGVSPADYKHIALGLIFLKYISDAFEAKYAQLKAAGEDTEDKDEYLAENVFWVPKEARWSYLQANAKQPTIGKLIDTAMLALEADNASLKGVLPKEYAHPALSKTMLGELIDLFGKIDVGGDDAKAKDIFGRVYEYFLSEFAGAANSIRRVPWSIFWSICWSLIKAASMTRAVVPGACSFNLNALWNNMADALAILLFTGRKLTM